MPPLSATIAGSFQVVTLPRKMSARVAPSSFIAPACTPCRLMIGTTPPITDGNWARPDFASSSGASGLSDEPKSTVARSEERRVGKECNSRMLADDYKRENVDINQNRN